MRSPRVRSKHSRANKTLERTSSLLPSTFIRVEPVSVYRELRIRSLWLFSRQYFENRTSLEVTTININCDHFGAATSIRFHDTSKHLDSFRLHPACRSLQIRLLECSLLSDSWPDLRTGNRLQHRLLHLSREPASEGHGIFLLIRPSNQHHLLTRSRLRQHDHPRHTACSDCHPLLVFVWSVRSRPGSYRHVEYTPSLSCYRCLWSHR